MKVSLYEQIASTPLFKALFYKIVKPLKTTALLLFGHMALDEVENGVLGQRVVDIEEKKYERIANECSVESIAKGCVEISVSQAYASFLGFYCNRLLLNRKERDLRFEKLMKPKVVIAFEIDHLFRIGYFVDQVDDLLILFGCIGNAAKKCIEDISKQKELRRFDLVCGYLLQQLCQSRFTLWLVVVGISYEDRPLFEGDVATVHRRFSGFPSLR